LEAVAFAPAIFGWAAGFAPGFAGGVLTAPATATGSAAGSGSAATDSDAGSTLATAIVLDSVRWQVSQVTMVRTSAPSWCCSFRSVRGRPQNEQKATSVVTTT
jgi:hypothetical protein